KRIEQLSARKARPAPPALEHGGARIEEINNRVRVVFPEKPAEAIRTALKKAGFRWSPAEGAWQRHASPGAWYEAQRILGIDRSTALVRAPASLAVPVHTLCGAVRAARAKEWDERERQRLITSSANTNDGRRAVVEGNVVRLDGNPRRYVVARIENYGG